MRHGSRIADGPIERPGELGRISERVREISDYSRISVWNRYKVGPATERAGHRGEIQIAPLANRSHARTTSKRGSIAECRNLT